MITTTTSTIPNAEITEIISVVHNRIVLGTNLFSDIGAGFSDIFGGKNTAYEKRLAEQKEFDANRLAAERQIEDLI